MYCTLIADVVYVLSTMYCTVVFGEILILCYTLFSRIYPKGTRVDSSNYDPIPAWSTGNQMVALNYQTPGLPMQLNDSKFRENGGCGYVLKPAYMLSDAVTPMPPCTITIHVLSAQQLPKLSAKVIHEAVNPYVSVSLHGMGDDSREMRTKTIKNNGFNPVWDEVLRIFVLFINIFIYIFLLFDCFR